MTLQKYRSLVELTSDWIWEVDQDGRYIYSSPKVKDTLGFLPQEVIGKTPFDLMPTEEAVRVKKLFLKFLNGRQPFSALENVNLHKDGHKVVLETSGVPIFSEHGEFVGYRGIDRDITERKEAQLASQHAKQELERRVDQRTAEMVIRASERKYNTLVHNIPGMVYKGYPDWSAEIISGSIEVCGFTNEEINSRSRKWLSIVHPDDMDRIFMEDSESAKEQKHWIQIYRIIDKEGRIRWVEDHKSSLFSETGGFIGVDGVVFDVTENKLAEKELEAKTRGLEEVNTALKVLLNRLNDEKKEIEERVLLNIKQLVTPQIEKLKSCTSTPERETFLGILEFNLDSIISNFSTRLGSDYFGLSPSELNVANLINQGKTSKEISRILNLSPRTIDRHRANIRKKLGIANTRKNLRSVLSSLR